MAVQDALIEVAPRAAQRRPRWQRLYAIAVIAADAVAMLVAIGIGHAANLGNHGSYVVGMPLGSVAVVTTALWVLALALSGGYESTILGSGFDEYKRVVNAIVRITAVGAFAIYITNAGVARGFVIVVLPLSCALTLTFRWIVRRPLHLGRRAGHYVHRVVVVGPQGTSEALASAVNREPWAGLRVVAGLVWAEAMAPMGIERALQEWEADTVAVAPGAHTSELRELAWRLEGTGVDLVVTPGLTNVAGPRVHIRPVSGLPLLYVESPEDRLGWRPLKHFLDRVTAALLLLLLSPLILVLTVAIRCSSAGPVFFRQPRWGYRGDQFMIVKFRTMVDGADAQFRALVDASGTGHGMFVKDAEDPRVTRVGRWLRRFSLDEVPQLVNVLRGQMSLVGPRPLPITVLHDAEEAKRRFLVRPGMTGLWQVSGRSDLPWEEALRLDLYYIENWSFALDLQILTRTVRAVLARKGAY